MPPSWASASTMSTPGSVGRPGKCPAKNGSSPREVPAAGGRRARGRPRAPRSRRGTAAGGEGRLVGPPARHHSRSAAHPAARAPRRSPLPVANSGRASSAMRRGGSSATSANPALARRAQHLAGGPRWRGAEADERRVAVQDAPVGQRDVDHRPVRGERGDHPVHGGTDRVLGHEGDEGQRLVDGRRRSRSAPAATLGLRPVPGSAGGRRSRGEHLGGRLGRSPPSPRPGVSANRGALAAFGAAFLAAFLAGLAAAAGTDAFLAWTSPPGLRSPALRRLLGRGLLDLLAADRLGSLGRLPLGTSWPASPRTLGGWPSRSASWPWLRRPSSSFQPWPPSRPWPGLGAPWPPSSGPWPPRPP